MDFVGYAEAAAALLNTGLDEVDDLRRHLEERPRLARRATDRDCMVLRRFRRELFPVFVAGSAGDHRGVVERLNVLMVSHPITPRISDHDAGGLHLHVATESASVADLLIGESLLGLATVVCDQGPTRLGLCDSRPCTHAFVDVSPNQSRRYCSDRCASRAHVAAHRARRRAAVVPAPYDGPGE